jgi:hypothetical protein
MKQDRKQKALIGASSTYFVIIILRGLPSQALHFPSIFHLSLAAAYLEEG